jgi:hypothetical protein
VKTPISVIEPFTEYADLDTPGGPIDEDALPVLMIDEGRDDMEKNDKKCRREIRLLGNPLITNVGSIGDSHHV